MLLPLTVLLLNYLSSAVSVQSNSFIKCGIYSAFNTDSASQNYVTCQIDNVCPGVKLSIGDCSSSCSGDQYIRLFDASNTNQLAGNDDGACESPLNLCSSMEYSYNDNATGCVSMVLRQGCYDTGSCSGHIKVNYIYTAVPTYAPSALPTAAPSSARPTTPPSIAVVLGVNDVSCAPYTASNTNKANTRYAVCNFQLCPGTVLTVGDCADSCSGDQFIRLFDGSNNLVMYDDDGCNNDPYSLCSQLTYVYSSGVCQMFSLHQGCYGDEPCGGTMSITKTTTSTPSAVPTVIPTVKPTAEPTFRPTVAPSTVPTTIPSAVPSTIPTSKPSSTPTLAPTQMPYTGFSTTDINDLTPVLPNVWYRSKFAGVVYNIYDCSYNLADDAACQAAYPGAFIMSGDSGDGQIVKFALMKERRAPTALPTTVPTLFPTAKPSPVPSTIPTASPGPSYTYIGAFRPIDYPGSSTQHCIYACYYLFSSLNPSVPVTKYHCSNVPGSVSTMAYYNKFRYRSMYPGTGN